jgi:hypothetical protein
MRSLGHEDLYSYLSTAPLFRKVGVVHVKDIEVVASGEEREVQTIVNGIVETKKLAKAGDLILRGPAGERFVSSKKSFDRLHLRDPNNPDVYHTQHAVRAALLKEDTIIRASWGEDMVILAGGVAVLRLNDNRFYGNQAETFAATYSRFSANNDKICDLTLPLEEQLKAAKRYSAIDHEFDIIRRITFRDSPMRPREPVNPSTPQFPLVHGGGR